MEGAKDDDGDEGGEGGEGGEEGEEGDIPQRIMNVSRAGETLPPKSRESKNGEVEAAQAGQRESFGVWDNEIPKREVIAALRQRGQGGDTQSERRGARDGRDTGTKRDSGGKVERGNSVGDAREMLREKGVKVGGGGRGGGGEGEREGGGGGAVAQNDMLLTFNEVVDLCQTLFLDGSFDPPRPLQHHHNDIPEGDENARDDEEAEGGTFLTSVAAMDEGSRGDRGLERAEVERAEVGGGWQEGEEAPLQQFWQWLEESELADEQPFRHVTTKSSLLDADAGMTIKVRSRVKPGKKSIDVDDGY